MRQPTNTHCFQNTLAAWQAEGGHPKLPKKGGKRIKAENQTWLLFVPLRVPKPRFPLKNTSSFKLCMCLCLCVWPNTSLPWAVASGIRTIADESKDCVVGTITHCTDCVIHAGHAAVGEPRL